MTPALLPVTIIAFLVVSFLALRPFAKRVRITFDVVCFIALSALLLQRRASPFLSSATGELDSAALWLRAIAGLWWLLGARVVVFALSFTINRNSRSRESRLFPDLTAAAIYVAGVVIVLTAVLALPVGGL